MFLKRLNPKESVDVQLGARLFCASPSYMQQTFGRPPTAEDGRRFVTDVPAGCAPEDVLVFAAFDKATPLGVMQVQRHFVRRDLASIGLLLVDPAVRRRHLGCQMLAQLSRQARNWPEVSSFCVMVVQTNAAGLAFWHHAGFTVVAQDVVEPPYRSRVTILERAIKHKQSCVAAPRTPSTPSTPHGAKAEPAADAGWLSARLPHKR